MSEFTVLMQGGRVGEAALSFWCGGLDSRRSLAWELVAFLSAVQLQVAVG